jgi:hypothetical protein
MKKVFVVILSLIYFTLSSEAMVNLHYCKGELKSIDINSSFEDCCCQMVDMDNGCCEDEQFQADIETDEYAPVFYNFLSDNFLLLPYCNNFNDSLYFSENKDNHIVNYVNPPPEPEPIWLVNCTFTFYG